jgi:hypothetical protein
MLGRRSPQRRFFDVLGLPNQVVADSLYGCMGAVSDMLFPDDDLAAMYCLDNGRPSLPLLLRRACCCKSSTMMFLMEEPPMRLIQAPPWGIIRSCALSARADGNPEHRCHSVKLHAFSI